LAVIRRFSLNRQSLGAPSPSSASSDAAWTRPLPWEGWFLASVTRWRRCPRRN